MIKTIEMKTSSSLLLALMTVLLAGCQAVGAIFKTGVWVGVLGVVFIVAIVIYLVGRSKKG